MNFERRRTGPLFYSLVAPLLVFASLLLLTDGNGTWLADSSAEEIVEVTSSAGTSLGDIDGVAAWKDLSEQTRLTAITRTAADSPTRWYHDLTAEQVEMKVQEHLAERIDELSAYWSNDGLRFAVIFVPNRGAGAVDWWWFHGLTADEVRANLAEHGAELTDIEGYRADTGTVYAGVMEGPTKRQKVGS